MHRQTNIKKGLSVCFLRPVPFEWNKWTPTGSTWCFSDRASWIDYIL